MRFLGRVKTIKHSMLGGQDTKLRSKVILSCSKKLGNSHIPKMTSKKLRTITRKNLINQSRI